MGDRIYHRYRQREEQEQEPADSPWPSCPAFIPNPMRQFAGSLDMRPVRLGPFRRTHIFRSWLAHYHGIEGTRTQGHSLRATPPLHREPRLAPCTYLAPSRGHFLTARGSRLAARVA